MNNWNFSFYAAFSSKISHVATDAKKNLSWCNDWLHFKRDTLTQWCNKVTSYWCAWCYCSRFWTHKSSNVWIWGTLPSLCCFHMHVTMSGIPLLISRVLYYFVLCLTCATHACFMCCTHNSFIYVEERFVFIRDFWAFFQKCICEVTHCCWTRRSDFQPPL